MMMGDRGAGILLDLSVPRLEILLRIPFHAVAIHVRLRNSYTICSLYFAPDLSVVRDDLVELLH